MPWNNSFMCPVSISPVLPMSSMPAVHPMKRGILGL
jgi:hypothetical protein